MPLAGFVEILGHIINNNKKNSCADTLGGSGYWQLLAMKINNKDIQLDAEGYLINPEDWDHEVARELAKTEGLTLNDDYWQVFDFIRQYYQDNQKFPEVRHTIKHLVSEYGFNKKRAKAKLFFMFPHGYFRQACKTSGIRRPEGWKLD